MKKMVIVAVFLLCGLSIFAQTPSYTTERMSDGLIGYTCPTENDALLLLNGNYYLPDKFYIAVLLKGIYLRSADDNPLLPKGNYMLEGTKLVASSGGPLGGLVAEFYNLNRNTEYYVIWKRDNLGTAQIPLRFTSVVAIADKNFNPLTPARR